MSDILTKWADEAYCLASSLSDSNSSAIDDTRNGNEDINLDFDAKLRVIGAGVFSLDVKTCSYDDISDVMESTYGLVTSFFEDSHQFAEALLFCAVQKKEYGENVMSMGMEMLSYVKELVAVYAEAITFDPSTPSTPQKVRNSSDVANSSPRGGVGMNATKRGSEYGRGSISFRRGSDSGFCTHCIAKDFMLAERLRTLNDKYMIELCDREKITELQSLVSSLQGKNQVLTHANEQMDSTIHVLEKQATASELHILQLDHQIIGMEKTIFKQKEEFTKTKTDTFNNDIEALESKVKASLCEIDDLKHELAKYQKVEAEIKVVRYESSQLERELMSHKSDLKEAISNMQHAEDMQQNIEKQLQVLKEQQGTERVKAAAVTAEYKSLVESNDLQYLKAIKENRDMKSQIEDLILERAGLLDAAGNAGSSTTAGKSGKNGSRRKSVLEIQLESMDEKAAAENWGEEDEGSRRKSMQIITANVFAMELEMDRLQSEVSSLTKKLAVATASNANLVITPVKAPSKAQQEAITPAAAALPPPVAAASTTTSTGGIAATCSSSSSTGGGGGLGFFNRLANTIRSESVEVSKSRLEELEREERDSMAVIEGLRRDLGHAEKLLVRLYEAQDEED